MCYGSTAMEAPRGKPKVIDLVRGLVPVPRKVDRGENWSLFSFLDGELLERVPEKSDLAAEAAGVYLPEDWRKRAQLVDVTSPLEFLTSTRSDAFKQQCVGRVKRFLRAFDG